MLRLLINLDRSADRLAWMNARLEQLGLDFQRIPAVDGKALTPALIADTTLPRVDGTPWAAGEVACFLSHIECWKIAAEHADSHTAIFEDDVHFEPEAGKFLRESSWIPDHVDVVKLETYRQPTLIDRGSIRALDRSISRLWGRHWGSAAYIVSKSAARKLLDAVGAFDCTVDEFLFDPREQKNYICYQLHPSICIQDAILNSDGGELGSVIHGERLALQGEAPVAQKPRGIAKIRRELIRPFRRLRSKAGSLYRFLVFGKRTVTVPFSISRKSGVSRAGDLSKSGSR